MKIEKSPEFRARLLKKIEEREFKERTGVHQSDLVFCLNKAALRRLKPLPIDDNDMLLFSLGWSTQRWLTGKEEDEPEKEVDGIIVTLDAMSEESSGEGTNYYVPWELKCTFQSSERPIEESIYWIRQLMAQVYVSNVKVAYLSRLEVMGNWRSIFGKKEEKNLPENRKPTLTAYRFEFSDEELKANWEWLKQRRDTFKTILESGQLVTPAEALAFGMEFECGRCGYKDLCGGC